MKQLDFYSKLCYHKTNRDDVLMVFPFKVP